MRNSGDGSNSLKSADRECVVSAQPTVKLTHCTIAVLPNMLNPTVLQS